MAIVITKEIKKKRILLGAALALLVASFLIIYFGLFYEPKVPAVSSSSNLEVAAGQKVPDLNVDIFNDERFKILKSPPGVPIATDTPGKINPFSD